MSTEIAKNLMCVVIRGGLEIWIEEEKLENLKGAMERKEVLKIDGNIINTVDITGVFKAALMEDRTRRKNGYWQCDYGFWHEKFNQCAHIKSDIKQIKI